MNTLLRTHYGAAQLSAGQIVKDPVLLLAFGFGSGLAKYAPGTFGTLAALPIYWALQQLPWSGYFVSTLILTLIGIPICRYAADQLAVHDFGGIVWDEIAGFLITLLWIDASWLHVVEGFALFRAFDIIKPWPIRWLDRRIHGGLGIMLDDVAAGLAAAAMLAVIN